MNEVEVLEVLRKVGVIVTGHFRLPSGRHSAEYINKDALYPHTAETSRLCRALANRFLDDCVDVVAAPATGGIPLSHWTAHHLSEATGRDVLAVYAEKTGIVSEEPVEDMPPGTTRVVLDRTGKVLRFARGYGALVFERRVLVVDDVLTSGDSARRVSDAVRAAGGTVVGVGALWNREGVTPKDVDAPILEALVNIKLDSWDSGPCRFCARDEPIDTSVGHGRAFPARAKT